MNRKIHRIGVDAYAAAAVQAHADDGRPAAVVPDPVDGLGRPAQEETPPGVRDLHRVDVRLRGDAALPAGRDARAVRAVPEVVGGAGHVAGRELDEPPADGL